MSALPPVISVVGRKNAGKTTLVVALVRELTARGYRVGTIKHDAHAFQIDHEGKDSWRHAEAGAVTVAIASAARCAVIRQTPGEPALEELVARHFEDVDLVLTEGYRRGSAPRIEVRPPGVEPICRPAELIAVVGEAAANEGKTPRFGAGEAARLADLIEARFLRDKKAYVSADGKPPKNADEKSPPTAYARRIFREGVDSTAEVV